MDYDSEFILIQSCQRIKCYYKNSIIMKKNVKITAIMITLLFAGISILEAQHGRRRDTISHTRQQSHMNIPGLSDKQKEEISAIREGHQSKMDEYRLSRASVKTIEERNEIEAAWLLQQNEHIKSIKTVLTAEQVAYFDKTSLLRVRREQFRSGRGNGRYSREHFRSGRGHRNGSRHDAWNQRGRDRNHVGIDKS